MGFLSAPFSGLMYVFKEIAKRADHEMNDDEAIKAELVALHSSLEAGSITEQDFEAKEEELVARLTEIEERRAPRQVIFRGQRRPRAPHLSGPARPRSQVIKLLSPFNAGSADRAKH